MELYFPVALGHNPSGIILYPNNVVSMLMLKAAFSLFSNINQSAPSTLDWVLNNLSDFDWQLYMHHWEFPIQQKIIPNIKMPY